MIRGSSWKCGWCGDFGSLQRTPAKKSQNTAQITLTLSFVYHVDLPETWNDLKKALGQLAPKNPVLSQLLGKVLLHNISSGIQNARALPDEKKAEELRTFLTTTTDLNLGENAEEIMRDAKRGVLFREEAALSETDCGTFWTELLSTRPAEDYYNRVDPDGLFELFSELSSAYAYFGGKKDEEMGEAQDYQNTLEEAYHTHWQNKVLLHPDAERAKRLLAQGKFPNYEIFAVKSSWSNTQRKSRMKPPRISMNCRGNVFWMMCLQTTWKKGWRCGGGFWTSQNRL